MSDTSRGLRRILLVEDDSDIRSLATLALERVGGFEVEACSSGREALETFAAQRPDLVLLDVMMPGLDGLAVLERLRAADGVCDVPVVMLTAKVSPQHVERLIELGAAEVIFKPFDPMTLSESVRAAWQRAAG